MRRVAATFVLLAALVGFWLVAGGAGTSSSKQKYWVMFDNAFGLIKGGDLKIAGVRAGKITDLELDPKTLQARIGFEVSQTGFGGLHKDVRCEIRPQSLIGEYFVDCLPGVAKQILKPGATIPVQQTASTVPPDLVVDIMRRPYAERFGIILSQLGAGVAGGGEGLNAAIRRASPALRETEALLRKLAAQNQTLKALARDSDTVLRPLAANSRNVQRFVAGAERTATASAQRKRELAAGLHKLPGLLAELRPTMASLQDASTQLTPTLQNLDASSVRLRTFFARLGPFSQASRPAVRGLGRASVIGSSAIPAARPVVRQLAQFAKPSPELGGNLAAILEHLDNRKYAAETDPRSPGGQGYTGLEALLQYVFDQVQSVNLYNGDTHLLKVSPLVGECADYTDVQRLKQNPKLATDCGSYLGPNQPGINFPDPTGSQAQPLARRHSRPTTVGTKRPRQQAPSGQAPQSGASKPALPPLPSLVPKLPAIPKLPQVKPRLPGGLGGGNGLLGRLTGNRRASDRRALLDYLLGP
jgi:virulence factor Mce-like protein